VEEADAVRDLEGTVECALATRGERTAPHELLFESRRQLVFFGKSGEQIVLVVAVPPADVPIVILVVAALGIVVVVFPVIVPVPLG
jgi:hypothetical protein